MAVWGEKVWRARPVSFFHRTLLLIFDSFNAHIDEDVHSTVRNEHKTTTGVIPGGLTKKLQSLDISVNRSFKNHVRSAIVLFGGQSYVNHQWFEKGRHYRWCQGWSER